MIYLTVCVAQLQTDNDLIHNERKKSENHWSLVSEELLCVELLSPKHLIIIQERRDWNKDCCAKSHNSSQFPNSPLQWGSSLCKNHMKTRHTNIPRCVHTERDSIYFSHTDCCSFSPWFTAAASGNTNTSEDDGILWGWLLFPPKVRFFFFFYIYQYLIALRKW